MNSDKSSKTWVVNSCQQPPSPDSKTQSVSGMGESGKQMRDDCSTSSASSLLLTICTVWHGSLPLSPAQWILGRGLRLPVTLLDQTGRLSLHERVTRDRTFSERIAMVSAAHRSITSLRYGPALSRAVLAVLDPMVRTLLDSFSRSETLCITGEATARQNVNGLHTCMAQRQSLVCNTSRNGWHIRQRQLNAARVIVRHATASEQLPLGPMLDALLAPPVPLGRDMQVLEDLFLDLDTRR